MTMRLLSRIEFGSLLVYAPRGSSDSAAQSKQVCYDIKDGGPHVSKAVQRLQQVFESGENFRAFFGDETVLVPAPRSHPIHRGGPWPADLICVRMISHNLGAQVLRCLARREAVPKSSYAGPGTRPNAQKHLSSMEVDPSVLTYPRITLVDDVITSGATMCAAVSLVQDAFPDSEVRAFAIVRTLSDADEIPKILNPCEGVIECYGEGQTWRNP